MTRSDRSGTRLRHNRLPPRRVRLRRTIVAVVVLGTIGVISVAAAYGWRLAGRHHAVADRCQVIGETTGVSYTMDPEQLLNASIIADLAMRRALPQQAVIVALATTLQESKLRNLDYGDRDSVGLFQQRPSQGWGPKDKLLDPVYASGKFYDALLKVQGWQSLPVAAAAQAVQRSGFPDAYASWQQRATAMAAALTGSTSGQLTCRLAKPGVDPKGVSTGVPSAASASPRAGPATRPLDAAVATLTAALATDLQVTSPAVATLGSKSKTITVSGLADQAGGTDSGAEHRSATVSAWALAHAPTGITKVLIGDREWRPDRDGWQHVSVVAAPGTVVMTVTTR
jgi:hypothetical protein